LADVKVTLQPGAQFLATQWAIDQLMSLYLTDQAPDRFTLEAGDVWLQLRGCRGELRMTRLARADFVFRVELSAGQSIGDAAFRALEIDSAFDPGQALLDLLDERLVVAIETRPEGGIE
jgi:hypothetical protein